MNRLKADCTPEEWAAVLERQRRGGMSSETRERRRAADRTYRALPNVREKRLKRTNTESGRAYYREAGRKWRRENPARDRARKDAFYAVPENYEKLIEQTRQRVRTPEGRMRNLLSSARGRAKRKGRVFSITLEDLLPLPTHCPVFPWIELNYGAGRAQDFNRPSIDRIDNSKGYERGNVCVISYRANTIKSNATPTELQRLAIYTSSAVGLV